MSDLDEPSQNEYLLTGIIGLLLYGLILYLSLLSLSLGTKSKSTKRFFTAITVMAFCELPRFLLLAVERAYTSRVCYSFHVVAGVFFFLAFSIVCKQWYGLLQLGSYFKVVYSNRSLILSNVSFAIIDLVTIILCLLSSSLQHFFWSTAFEVMTFLEGVRNVVYSVFLCFYGLKLVKRFWHFSSIERDGNHRKAGGSSTTATSATTSRGGGSTGRSTQPIWCLLCSVTDDQVFTKVVVRLTSVLVLATLCFIVRVAMLIAKMAIIHDEGGQATSSVHSSLQLFGFWWFVCSDFIPRALPALAFIFLMGTKRPKQETTPGAGVVDGSLTRSLSGNGDFQFVSLPSSEELQPYDFKGPGGTVGLSMESMLFHKMEVIDPEDGTEEITLSTLHKPTSGNGAGEDGGAVYSDEEGDGEGFQDPGEATIDRIFSLLQFGKKANASNASDLY